MSHQVSNLYAAKIYAEHPLGLWALDDDFAFQSLSVNEVSEALASTEFAGEFRNLVRSQGTDYARRLARKALRYRGIENEYSR